jgi:hypothetical protein
VAQSPATESPSGWLNNSEAAGGEFPETHSTRVDRELEGWPAECSHN